MTTPQPAATMTKQEAIEAMKQGHRVTHRFFGSSEWIRLIGGRVFAEDGVTIADSIEDFLTHEYRTNLTWDADWSIFNDLGAGAEATGKSPENDFKESLAIEVVARFHGNSRGLPIAKREFINGAMWAFEQLQKSHGNG